MFSRLIYRIPFSETDAMEIVHHSNYARYFERGRVEMLRQLELSYAKFMETGLHFPVTEMSITYRRPVKFDDIIAVETRITKLTKTRLQFSYRIFMGAENDKTELIGSPLGGQVLTEATTEHCCVNDQGRPLPIPKDTHARLSKFLVGQEAK